MIPKNEELFLLICLFIIIPSNALYNSYHPISCDRERLIVTDSYGIITNGNKEYPMDSHCEWLIKANSSDLFITLSFIKMDTECSYDHIFIYDGDSYSSPLLGSFSGNTTPPLVTSNHGLMLILLYSDTNYVRSGFQAIYSITNCPLNCSDRGQCLNHKCFCDPLWAGRSCEISLCPSACGITDGRGECQNKSSVSKCKCKPGYSGMDCSLPDSNKNGGNTWHLLASDVHNIEPRAGHSGTYVFQTDSFYVFGGYTFREVLGDFIVFSFERNEWISLSNKISPGARHGHAAVSYKGNVVLFGGELDAKKFSNEMWIFNTSSQEWSMILPKNYFLPPPLTKHSMVLVEEQWLYVIGGSLSDGTFSSSVYRINIADNLAWEKVDTYGNKESIHRVVGHTAVYYQQMKTIFIFGGVIAEYSHVSKLSNHIHAYHVEKRFWTKVKYGREKFIPLERAFHTASIIGDYMVVYGGYTHKHAKEEICYDNEFHLYHLRCNKWIDFDNLRRDFTGISNPISQGVFSHAMSVRRGHTLVVHGGYNGMMRSHLLAYVLPSAIISDQLLSEPCSRHKHLQTCESNLACGWCGDKSLCIEKKNSKVCSKFSSDTCRGFCSALSNCYSCLIWSHPFGENAISDSHENLHSDTCAWCGQALECYPINDPPFRCATNSSSNSKRSSYVSGSSNWWGPYGTGVLSIEDCYSKDRQPGIVSIKYKHPVNWSQPDDVSFLRMASEELFFRPETQTNDTTGLEENIVKFLGYIHPLGAKPLSERMSQLQLFSCTTISSAIFKLSNDSTMKNLEVVASHSPKPSFYCSNAQRPKGALLFNNDSMGFKYMFDFTVKIPATVNETSNVQLNWNAFSVTPETITFKYLEPYFNGSCSQFKSCLACMTDAACGWCEKNDHCYPKVHHKEECEENGMSFLVTHPNDCTVCSDYIYCELCAQFDNCEWLVETAVCVRRGRFQIAVKDPKFCPHPCHMRSSCSSCLGDPGMCAWCEETRTCFLFSTYTSAYSYGRCRDWVDENRSEYGSDPVNLCRNCSRHTQCSSCIKDLACGWCSYSKLPMTGVCADGDFSGVSSGTCPMTLNKGDDMLSDFKWSYSSCPDVEECLWNLHECHVNATCINTPESYMCECNSGFEGDGRQCVRACAVKCVHGFCNDAPNYECVCDLGWTGEDCSISCGCNNHSSCLNGVGLCDECQDWTEGIFCETCKTGSYGDASTSTGCQKCNCNGHGDPEQGFCNATTGVCFCLNKTTGSTCAKCLPGYYGDPRNNGDCFEECNPRKVITNATSGKLGSPVKTSASGDCLWMLTVHSVLDMQSLLGPMQSTGTYIQLIIHKDLNVPCPHNHIYIYDGLPNFVASGHPNVLLGAFCGFNLTQPITATAASGYLTVHFKHDSLNHGFNATYIRLENCSSVSSRTSPCYDENCADKVNYTYCRGEKCPRNCSSFLNQGTCDQIVGNCLCNEEFGGKDCSIQLRPNNLVWSEVFDRRRLLQENVRPFSPTERIGHSLIAVANSSTNVHNLWLYGGYSSAFGFHNDLFCFDVLNKQWRRIPTDNSPPNRHFHAYASSKESFFVYGGLGDNVVHGDFWVFNTSTGDWSQLPDIVGPSGLVTLAGGTLTAVNDHKLVLIGGFSPTYGFYDKVMEFDFETKLWTFINCTGAQPIGIYGHTSVYHSMTDSIYVFGGITYDVERVAATNKLYAFHYSSSQWFRLPPDGKVNPLKSRPLPRYFHASVAAENYIIILGGRNSGKLDESIDAYAYVFSCNLWIPLTDKAIEVIGQIPRTLMGASAVAANGKMYIYGGRFNHLMSLSLPSDICHMFSTNSVGCVHQTGCSLCTLIENEQNRTYCYSQDKHDISRCYNPTQVMKYIAGVNCDSNWIEKRDCHQYTSCSDCVTSWPFHNQANQVCQWCSNCRAGRCVPAGFSCDEENDCNIPRKVIEEPSVCPLRVCGASDCEKCGDQKTCIWTRQVYRSSGFVHTLNKKPIYNWVCVMKEILSAPPFPIESMPPNECPIPCLNHTDCVSCLKSQGAEGGWNRCFWSESLQQCMSPTYELLRCEDGSCGPVFRGNETTCPLPCWQHFQASDCLSQASCGWCAFSGPKVDGRGLCMNGGIMGPTGGICKETQVLLLGLTLPVQTAKWFLLSEGPPTWTYLTKPPENECENGHHNCDDAHEECIDTLKGFECHCKQGYTFKGKQCTPTCNQGCVNGTCIQPNVCQCNFGYVGFNCSTMCKCNGHSDCPGPDKLDVCIECKNNTLGPQCQKCKPFFVGNPVNGGKCVSCHEYCYKHSGMCLSSDLLVNATNQPLNQTVINDIIEKLEEGALEDAVCLDCQNNTEGRRCDQCIPGFFKAGENLEDGCRPCECHGHGDMCNPLNGENCNCQNNTENDRQCSQKNMKNIMNITPCWQLQCSKCREYFLGAPIHGHQCYRHMFLDKEYCFDPNTQDECNRNPASLSQGHTVFFAVQPRYMNVDIRIVVDVTAGGIDFFLSAKEDAFIVDVDKVGGIHHIYVDEKYGINLGSEYDLPPEVEATLRRRKRESVQEEVRKVSSNTTESVPVHNLHPKIGTAQGLTTYIDVKRCEEFLLVRNLENRLIVTIPQEVHDLRSTRFYMILRGSGSFASRSTYGSLFFRQDQTRIDLFVFFSVFFSCFFLFLAACVVMWKVKQAFDLRRARRLHAAEMKHMASRPFGHIVTIVDDETDDFLLYSPSNYRKKMKHGKSHGIDSPKIHEDKFSLRPLAVEPLSDGYAAVTTILVQLPGGSQSLVRMTLASSLITLRSSHYHTGCGLRAAMRRRTSHANV